LIKNARIGRKGKNNMIPTIDKKISTIRVILMNLVVINNYIEKSFRNYY